MNLQTFTSLEGRIPRKGFWLGFLVLMVITWILEFILFAIFGVGLMGNIDPSATPEAQAAAASAMFGKMMVPLGILTLLLLWPSICLYAKRWHDRDKSGWWSLILLIPFIGGIWMLIELGFLRGTDGPNRFGPDPIAG
jgi:uncharacterized membrane protein YhaH (DUF805 family)